MRFRIRFALFGAITAVALTGFSANAGEGYVRDSVLYIPRRHSCGPCIFLCGQG